MLMLLLQASAVGILMLLLQASAVGVLMLLLQASAVGMLMLLLEASDVSEVMMLLVQAPASRDRVVVAQELKGGVHVLHIEKVVKESGDKETKRSSIYVINSLCFYYFTVYLRYTRLRIFLTPILEFALFLC